MNRVKTRALSVLILVAVAILGIGFYVVRYILYADDWAAAPFNETVFRRGVLTVGTVTDRNGVILADVTDGNRTFAGSGEVRRSTLHAVGDMDGNIGTGALVVYAPELMGFNLITGSYSRTGGGETISLTIDSQLNVEALRALNGRRGVVLVSNYETGEVLCMVSSPTFDPNDPPVNPDDELAPYVNRAIQSVFTPGSTFKLITAAAAIERIPDIHNRNFECKGLVDFGADTLTCPREHGSIGFEQGMRVSCNIVFGDLALELGGGRMLEYADKYGFTERIKVGELLTARGNFDSAASGSVNLAWSGVGQFTNTVCPATMLRFVGAIANEGRAVNLQLLKRTGISALIPAGSTRLMNRNTAKELSEIIEIQNRENFPGLSIHAKSGTAQVGNNKDPHAWYVGYITNKDYPLAFVVMVENGGGGTAVAAPIANRVLQLAIK